ncbi:hypothetical protein AB0H71_24690 [Nocardia sp. NPDC050697]|uniref:hypothetical protein n=1 Tax=Nocardia sp. NPDC050697 TaxID=3155158 RepID=UPI00340F8063
MTDQLPVYSVSVSREDDLWVAVVDGVPGGATDVEQFGELPGAVSDLIATLLDIDPDDFWIEWHYRQNGHDFTELVERLQEWEKLADRAARSRDASRLAAVEAMRAAGLSYRAIADAIGISHQRVGQLLADSEVELRGESPEQGWIVQAKWGHQLRNSIVHGQSDGERPSPYEAVLLALLTSALRVRPDSRHELLAQTANVLEDVARDSEFLRSTG